MVPLLWIAVDRRRKVFVITPPLFSCVPPQVMICLLQYFVESLTVVLPYYPTGTMERVVKEGQVQSFVRACVCRKHMCRALSYLLLAEIARNTLFFCWWRTSSSGLILTSSPWGQPRLARALL